MMNSYDRNWMDKLSEEENKRQLEICAAQDQWLKQWEAIEILLGLKKPKDPRRIELEERDYMWITNYRNYPLRDDGQPIWQNADIGQIRREMGASRDIRLGPAYDIKGQFIPNMVAVYYKK